MLKNNIIFYMEEVASIIIEGRNVIYETSLGPKHVTNWQKTSNLSKAIFFLAGDTFSNKLMVDSY